MDDLRSRLAALDHIAVPDQWPEIKRRSWAPTTPTVSTRTRWIGTGKHPQRRSSPMLTPVRVLAVGLVAALSTGLLAVSLSGPSADRAGGFGAPGASPGVLQRSHRRRPLPASGQPIDWDTGCVQLTADWLRIYPDTARDEPSQVFTGRGAVVAALRPGQPTPIARSRPPGRRAARRCASTSTSPPTRTAGGCASCAPTTASRRRTGSPIPGPLFEAPLGQTYGGDVMLDSAHRATCRAGSRSGA